MYISYPLTGPWHGWGSSMFSAPLSAFQIFIYLIRVLLWEHPIFSDPKRKSWHIVIQGCFMNTRGHGSIDFYQISQSDWNKIAGMRCLGMDIDCRCEVVISESIKEAGRKGVHRVGSFMKIVCIPWRKIVLSARKSLPPHRSNKQQKKKKNHISPSSFSAYFHKPRANLLIANLELQSRISAVISHPFVRHSPSYILVFHSFLVAASKLPSALAGNCGLFSLISCVLSAYCSISSFVNTRSTIT